MNWSLARRIAGASLLWGLIGLNLVVFVLWNIPLAGLTAFMSENFVVSLDRLMELRVWTLLTSCISHQGTAHIAFNMLGLWMFGRQVIWVAGARNFLFLYVSGGILSAVAHVAWGVVAYWIANNAGLPTPDPYVGALGASGSVMAVAAVFACLFPWQRLLIAFVIPVPAFIAVTLFILIDVCGMGGLGTVADGGAGVAHAAHVGGAVWGVVFYFAWMHWRRQRLFEIWQAQRSGQPVPDSKPSTTRRASKGPKPHPSGAALPPKLSGRAKPPAGMKAPPKGRKPPGSR